MHLTRRASLVIGLGLMGSLVGCGAVDFFSDRMVGCYASKRDGIAELRVLKSGDDYNVTAFQRGAWADSSVVRRPTQAELLQLFGADTSAIAEGLVARECPAPS